MRVLCVAEKPSIAKAVASALAANYTTRPSSNKYIKNYDLQYTFQRWGSCHVTVTSVLGHLQNLAFTPSLDDWSSTPPITLFSAPVGLTVDKSLQNVASNIQKESRTANKLFIWTDCDREGECIGWEIASIACEANSQLAIENAARAVFSNVAPDHVRSAAQRPRALDMNQVEAVRTRMELDLRIGAALTRFQTLLFKRNVPAFENERKVLSYGPCQFPTLGFVVDRYKKVKNFVPETFWYIDLHVKAKSKSHQFLWDRTRLFDRASTVILCERCLKSADFVTIVSVDRKPASRHKPLPLTTVELQKRCAQHLGINSRDALKAAEKLYNQGYLSYPRTETDQFDPAIDLTSLVTKQSSDPTWGQYAKDLVDGKYSAPRKGSHNDKAHPPIHPVTWVSSAVLKSVEERKVYEFVVRHFLACCSADAKGVNTHIQADWFGEKFHCSGLVVTERNFLDIYPYIVWNSSADQPPDFTPMQKLSLVKADICEGQTTAPSHLTEPELIALMDVNGIGTDATIAEHIEKVIEREYVIRQTPSGAKRKSAISYLLPSTLGFSLVDGYDQIGFDHSLTKPFLRRSTEHMMVEICEGLMTRARALQINIDSYKGVFQQAETKSSILVSTVNKYLSKEAEA